MGDNSRESVQDETSISTPIWLIIIKWILVVVTCMWMFADSLAIIMAKKVTKRGEELEGSDSKIRIQATIELIICLVGLIGLIGHKFFIIVVHCICFALYFITLYFLNENEMFWFSSLWVITTAFYAHQIRIRRSRPVFDTTTTS